MLCGNINKLYSFKDRIVKNSIFHNRAEFKVFPAEFWPNCIYRDFSSATGLQLLAAAPL